MSDSTQKLVEEFEDDFYGFLSYLQEESENIFYIEEAEDYINPGNDYEDPQDFMFRYFKPLNEKGIIELNAFLSTTEEQQRLTLSDINKTICIELDDSNDSYARLSRMEEINKGLIKLYREFGYQVFIFEENGDVLQRLRELSVALRKGEGDNN